MSERLRLRFRNVGATLTGGGVQIFIDMHQDENTPQSIIDQLTLVDRPEVHRENLHELYLAFIRFYPDPTHEFMHEITKTYGALHDAIVQIEHLPTYAATQ